MLRAVLPDPKYNSTVVTEFIGVVLKNGKRTVAEQIVYSAIESLDEKINSEESALDKFEHAVENVKPQVEVKSRRVGGANYQVPIEVPARRATAVAFRWLVEAAKKRSEHTMAQKLANELAAAYNNEGNAVRKKIETHKMADANKAFAHFRW
jgi:small subunit ribosomal protein S7